MRKIFPELIQPRASSDEWLWKRKVGRNPQSDQKQLIWRPTMNTCSWGRCTWREQGPVWHGSCAGTALSEFPQEREEAPPQSAGDPHTGHNPAPISRLRSANHRMTRWICDIIGSKWGSTAKLDFQSLDMWSRLLVLDFIEMSRVGGNHRLLWHGEQQRDLEEWTKNNEDENDHDPPPPLSDRDDILSVGDQNPTGRRLQRHCCQDRRLCQPRLLQPVHQAPHSKFLLPHLPFSISFAFSHQSVSLSFFLPLHSLTQTPFLHLFFSCLTWIYLWMFKGKVQTVFPWKHAWLVKNVFDQKPSLYRCVPRGLKCETSILSPPSYLDHIASLDTDHHHQTLSGTLDGPFYPQRDQINFCLGRILSSEEFYPFSIPIPSSRSKKAQLSTEKTVR